MFSFELRRELATLTLDSPASSVQHRAPSTAHRLALQGASRIPAPPSAKFYAAAAHSGYFLIFSWRSDSPRPSISPGQRFLLGLGYTRWIRIARRPGTRTWVRAMGGLGLCTSRARVCAAAAIGERAATFAVPTSVLYGPAHSSV